MLNRTHAILIGAIAGGAAAGLLVVVLLFFLFPRNPVETATAPNQAVSSAKPNSTSTSRPHQSQEPPQQRTPQLGPAHKASSSAPNPFKDAESKQGTQQRPSSSRKSKIPVPQPVQGDQRLLTYKLPNKTTSTAFNRQRGTLAVINRTGLAIYEIARLLRGDASASATIRVAGVPASVCLKTLPKLGQVYVVAVEPKKNNPSTLQLFDAQSHKLVGEVPITGGRYLQNLACSDNPNDPFVYGSLKSSKPHVARVNLLTMGQDQFESDGRILVTPDGSRLIDVGSKVRSGSWFEIQRQSTLPDFNLRKRSDAVGRLPTAMNLYCLLRHRFSHRGSIYDSTGTILIAHLPFAPGTEFRKRPVIVGLDIHGIVLASTNDYCPWVAIPFPDELQVPKFDKAKYEGRIVEMEVEVELIKASNRISRRLVAVDADDKNDCALITFENHLLIVRMETEQVPMRCAHVPALCVLQRRHLRMVLAVGSDIAVTNHALSSCRIRTRA